MRYSTRFKTNMRGRQALTILKSVLFVLLFSLIFVSVLSSTFGINLNFADAAVAVSRNATAVNVSTVSETGTNVAATFNSTTTSTNANKFGISSESNKGITDFGYHTGDGWGYVDWESSDIASVWWLEFTFSGAALQAVKAGNVSFYASADCDFSDGSNDECTMAINFVGQQDVPTVTWVDSSRLFSAASWTSTDTSNLAYKESWGESYSRTISYGAYGGYNSARAIPTSATGIRMIFACIADGAMDGGFTKLNLTLYSAPETSITSSGTTFDVTKGYYGEAYDIMATSTANWALATTTNTGSNTITKVAATTSSGVSHSSNNKVNGTVNYAGAGLIAKTGTNNSVVDASVTTTITVPKYVTRVTITGTIEFGMLAEWAYSADKTTTVDTSVTATYSSKTASASGTQLKKTNSSNNTSNTNYFGTDKSFTLYLDTSPSTNVTKTITVKLTLKIDKTDASGYSDTFYAWSTLGNLKVKFAGPYTVTLNRNGATGTNKTITYLHTIADNSTGTTYGNPTRTTSETYGNYLPYMKSGSSTSDTYGLGWTYSGKTFVGWSLESNGSVMYSNHHNTGSTELTKTPGASVTLYAIWKDSDFGVLSGKTRDGTWGSATNPFVISNKEYWLSLTDIVNGSRDPVDSVQGTYYGNKITGDPTTSATGTATTATAISYAGCYFVVTTNISVGATEGLGINSSTNYFQGTIFGGSGAYSGTRYQRTITVNIDSTDSSVGTGLFNYIGSASIEYLCSAGTIVSNTTMVGGIVGQIAGNATIKNCKSTANIIASSFNATTQKATARDGAGGIVGYIAGGVNVTIENCTYAGVTSSTYKNTDTDGNQDVNSNIYGSNGVGGIVGYMASGATQMVLNGCSTSGIIVGKRNVGGVAGRVETSKNATNALVIQNAYNSATVSAVVNSTSTVGGIVGYLYYSGAASTLNTVKMQYCYNQGAVSGYGANAGGLVGSATASNEKNVTLINCYSNIALSGAICGSSYVGNLVGTGTNTVTDCWEFLFQNATTVTSGVLGTADLAKGKRLVLAVSGGSASTYFSSTNFRPTKEVNGAYSATYTWANITSNDFEHFLLFGSQQSWDSTSKNYLRIRNCKDSDTNYNNDSRVMPISIGSTQSSETSETPTLYVKNVVFSAAQKDIANVEVKRLAVEIGTTTVTEFREITYGGTAPTTSNWGVTSTNNPYTATYAIRYYEDGEWKTSVKNAGKYSVKILFYNGTGNLVGMRIFNGSEDDKGYLINQRVLTLTPTNHLDATFNTGASYTYNGSHQGLQTLVIGNILAGDINQELFTSVCTSSTAPVTVSDPDKGTTTWTFAYSNTVNANTSNYTVSFNIANQQGNYVLEINGNKVYSTTYSWKINKKTLTVTRTFVTGYTGSYNYIYNGAHQGIDTIKISGIIEKDIDNDLFDITLTGVTEKSITKTDTTWQYQYEGAINASSTAYGVSLSLKDTNYQLTTGGSTLSATTWNINKKTLSISAKNHSGAAFTSGTNYTYNGAHQGLTQLVICEIVAGDLNKNLFTVTTVNVNNTTLNKADGAWTYGFAGAVNASDSTYQVSIALSDTNYQFNASGSTELAYNWTIGKKLLSFTAREENKVFTNGTQYVYNTLPQGLATLTLNGLIDGDGSTFASVLSYEAVAKRGETQMPSSYIVVTTEGNVASISTSNVSDYGFKIKSVDDSNYKFSDANITNYITNGWNWKITPIDIANAVFGYDYNGVAASCSDITIGGTSFYALQYKSNGVKYGENEAPFALVFRDVNDVYAKINSYNLYYTYGSQSHLMAYGDEYSLTLQGGTLSEHEIEFSEGEFVSVVMTLNGIGNYSGTYTVRFTLMASDFGGNYNSENWGSPENPYLIKNAAHLVRLSQIVNGDVAWNSINNSSQSANANSYAKAKTRTYANTVFVLTDNISVSTVAGFVSIGKNSDRYFAASFDGTYQGNEYNIELNIDETAQNEDYSGLFGYLKGATLKDIKVLGTVKGRDYVGGIAGYADGATSFISSSSDAFVNSANVTGRNFVGGIGGYIQSSLSSIKNTGAVSGQRAVGGVAGYFKGVLTSSENSGAISYALSTSSGTFDSNFFKENGWAFNGIGGLAGVIKTDGSRIVDSRNSGEVKGLQGVCVGGLVGFASSGGDTGIVIWAQSEEAIRNIGAVSGKNYIGGLAGYANNVTINETCAVNANVTATGNYCGGIAGKWIIYRSEQMPLQRRVKSEITISGDTYVGGFAGWLDAQNATGLELTLYITNGAAHPVKIEGKSYVGAMYGGFEGYGYKRNSQTVSGDDTVIYLEPGKAAGTNNAQIYVDMTLKAGGRVAGGIIGYASGVGLMLLGNWTCVDHTPFTFNGRTDFFGGLVGVLGENAVIGSAKQVTSGGYELVTDAHTVQYSSLSNTLTVGGDFAGSVVGYIASTAGAYYSNGTTTLGNSLQLINRSSISGNGFVGGIFGAIGRVSDYTVSGDVLLSKLLSFGKYDASATAITNNTLRYALSDSNGGNKSGKLINLNSVEGKANYVGGIVGYAGEGALLSLINTAVTGNETGFSMSNVLTYLSVYNGTAVNPSSSGSTTTINISGAGYVGGIVGYLSSSAHELTHVVSLMRITGTNNGEYVGGITGYMLGGTLDGCLTALNFTGSTDAFSGGAYVGGLAGMLAGGSVINSLSLGFTYSQVNSTRGGVVGGARAGTTITASWTEYLVTGSGSTKNNIKPNYSYVSANNYGKYVLIDSRLIKSSTMMPTYSECAKMVGLFTGDGIAVNRRATKEGVNDAKDGFISLSTYMPGDSVVATTSSTKTTTMKNMQLVFYDVSGADKNTDNVLDTVQTQSVTFEFDNITAKNGQMYYRFDMSSSSSFSICVIPIEFGSIPTCTSTNTSTKNKNAQDKYQKPASNDDRYIAEVTSADYDGVTHNISSLSANIKYKNGKNYVLIGAYYKNDFVTGSSETPYIISEQGDWNRLARHINGTQRITRLDSNGNKIDIGDNIYVKLATDSITVTGAADNPSTPNVDEGRPFMGYDPIYNFKGTFDGDGHYITISVTGSSDTNISAFPYAGGATFKNLTIKGSISTTGNTVGAFVAQPTGSLKFYNCTNSARIKAAQTAGGFVGDTNGKSLTFVTCVNTGSVTTTVGTDEKFKNVTYGTGGIVGEASKEITIESCRNKGTIKGGNNVGGIVGFTNAKINIYNSANTGNVTANHALAAEPENTCGLSYAGGIIGKVGANGYLRMYASYNSGTIIGLGSIVGGLAGSVGEMVFEGGAAAVVTSKKDKINVGGESIIAYCYNNGSVCAGGTTSTGKSSSAYGFGRENLNGSIVGGIVGAIGWGLVSYCYNSGEVTTYQLVGYLQQWQARMGGIAGQAQPTTSGSYVKFQYCYNIGLLTVEISQKSWEDEPVYGSGICGYMDEGDDVSTADQKKRLSGNSNYVLTNCIHYINKTTNDTRYATEVFKLSKDPKNVFDQIQIESGRYIDGSIISNVADFTTYHTNTGNGYSITTPVGYTTNQAASLIDSSGNYLAQYNGSSVNYDDNFLKGTRQGYIYIYGCLPQLAVFALDTKEGLSMLSVSYGKDDYDNWKGAQAGSEESPYIIKDGVDLLAMSTLLRVNGGSVNYPYTFHDKYVAFADGTNNIDGDTAKFINMDMSTSANAMKSGTSGTATSSYSLAGKNYFLWANGAAGGTGLQYNSSDDLRTKWGEKNYYFNGSSWENRNPSFNQTVNFYPIGTGGASSFMGNISGLQGTDGNTTVKNLAVSQFASTSYAGLFGSVYNATISNITVDGMVRAYTYDIASYKSFAGGIAGYAGGNTVIQNCIAGSSLLSVYAHGNSKALTSFKGDAYAGGIVGAAGPKRGPSSDDTQVRNLKIENCAAAYVNVYTAKSNAGGIAGFVGDVWGNSNVESNSVEISGATVDKSTVAGVDNCIATDIGGIVGTNDGLVTFEVSDVKVGATSLVYIKGKNSVGGVIGSARGNSAFGNIEIGTYARISRQFNSSNSSDVIANVDSSEGLYFTSIGGVIGRTISGTINTLRDVITFKGRIDIDKETTGSDPELDINPVANIGGIIGSMGKDTRFIGGCVVSVSGTIEIDEKQNNSFKINNARNIGGVVGATMDGIFDGYFDINPTIKSSNATNVGGFIGRNFGDANILASNTSVEIDGQTYTGTVININGDIKGKSEVGGLVGINGYIYNGNVHAGRLSIGADSVGGGVYNGSVIIVIGGKYNGSAEMFDIVPNTAITGLGNNVGGIVGSNIVSGTDVTNVQLGLLIRKGIIYNFASVSGADNVGGVVGNNAGDITMGGSIYEGATLMVVNGGNITGENNVGGSIGYLQVGSIAGTFANIGNVVGEHFVGGSIGRVDSEAVLTVGSENTYFYNGENPETINSSGLSDGSKAESGGNVTGDMYVGGSIGAVFGTIEGNANNDVAFYNVGSVTGRNGANYVGGNIGMLAGSVSHAKFDNSGKLTSDGNTAIGGSVGIIGYDSTSAEITHKQIFVQDVHFDFTGDYSVEVGGTSDLQGGGVGGSIGVIGGSDNGFDNSDGSKWQGVTLYTSNGVNAPEVYNVGGAIGSIKADRILISNMLAFYSTVVGKQNVGGIVGSVLGSGVEIRDSFNIEGDVVGATAGGIIGYAVTDTVADTSYWVKGYTNKELITLNISNISTELGKYTAVEDEEGTIYTVQLTDQYENPYAYTKNIADRGKSWDSYLRDLAGGQTVKKVNNNTVWAYETDDFEEYTTGESYTGWYYAYANDRDGLDTVHTVADDISLPSVLVSQEKRNEELKYWKRIAVAYTADEYLEDENGNRVDDVNDSVALKPLTSPIVIKEGAGIVGGGIPQSGHIYAAALASTKSGAYLYMDASGVTPTIKHGTENIWQGSESSYAPFYLDADTHAAKNVAIYYRGVAVINNKYIYNGEEQHLLITDKISDTSKIEYVERGETLTVGTSGSYVYTLSQIKKMPDSGVGEGENVSSVIDAGTYITNVIIYYCDSDGNYGVVGSIRDAEWIVKPKELIFTAEIPATGHFNKSKYETTVSVSGWVENGRDDSIRAAILKDFGINIVVSNDTGSTPDWNDYAVKTAWSSFPSPVSQANWFVAEWYSNSNVFSISEMVKSGSYGFVFDNVRSGNYCVTVEDEEEEYALTFFTITPNKFDASWSTDNTAVYNFDYHKYTATFIADGFFVSEADIKDEVGSMFENGQYTLKAPNGDDLTVTVELRVPSGQGEQFTKVEVDFLVGKDAGKYTVVLPDRTESCALETRPNGEYTITPLDVTISLNGSIEEVYNGGYHDINKDGNGITVSSDDANAALEIKFNVNSGIYTVTAFGDTTSVNTITFALKYEADGVVCDSAVNVGNYVAYIDDDNVSGSKNFNITCDESSGTITISAAQLSLSWGASSFTYNATYQGRKLNASLTRYGDGLEQSASISYNPQGSSATATYVLTNAFDKKETFTIPVTGVAAAVNASSYVASVDVDNIQLSATNAAGESAPITNYEIVFENATNGSYTIKKLDVTVTGINGGETSKVYDATTAVTSLGNPIFGSTIKPTLIDKTAVYDDSQAGERKIVYTFTLRSPDSKNFHITNSTFEVLATIEKRMLTVSLDKLKNGSATRVYNGNEYYGGEDGALSIAGRNYATSSVYRIGEGFTVTNIAVMDVDGAVRLTAMYKEATSGRDKFDAYVNNVTGSGSAMTVGSAEYGADGYMYKKLVFTLAGESSQNYTFRVCDANVSTVIGDKALGDAATTVAVNDKNNGGVGSIKIEITPYTLKANYSNTAQSYANADNTYNKVWSPITGSVYAVGDDSLTVDVVNNWRFENNIENGTPREYTSYTVIRGAVGSNVLSAKVSSQSGEHVNYRLSNQPVLTIGYFIDKDEFEIGSLASLMIATYYYSVSGLDNEFGEVISQAKWHFIVTDEDYLKGTGYPTVDGNGNKFVGVDGKEVSINSWDDYFNYLESEAGGGYEVFLNSHEGENSGWGYYEVTDSSMPKSYTKFKQIANVSGIMTEADMAILNGMFKKTTEDGLSTSYAWGAGGNYLTNFISAGVGNIVTVIDTLFKGVFDGNYDGNGYTIDTVNIVGSATEDNNYFGMFGRVENASGDCEISNLHLRNINMAIGGSGTAYVGAIAGAIDNVSVNNVSVHGTITVKINGTAYVGGLFGKVSAHTDGAIAIGNIRVNAQSATVGGVLGHADGAELENAVSLMQIWVDGNGGANAVGGLTGSSASVTNATFMANSVWNNGSVVSGGVTYTQLYNDSVSGYGNAANAYYYSGEQENSKGVYDVLDDVRLTALDGEEQSRTNPRESMRLADIIDVYVLLYAKLGEHASIGGAQVAIFGKAEKSALVGSKHGTDNENDAIVIANQQGIALLRELRFATFGLANDVYMYSTYQLCTASGAFFGRIITGGHNIYIRSWDGTTAMFEAEVARTEADSAAPTQVLKAE